MTKKMGRTTTNVLASSSWHGTLILIIGSTQLRRLYVRLRSSVSGPKGKYFKLFYQIMSVKKCAIFFVFQRTKLVIPLTKTSRTP